MAICYTNSEIQRLNGQINENQDGTVSVYIPDNFGKLAPVILNKQCCTLLNPNYVFDVENQLCLWTTSQINSCDINDPFKIVLNPQGNDGVILNFGSNDNCVLEIKFDYLFKVKCETLNEILLNGVNIDYSDINPELNNQINNLEASIEQQIVTCETISSQIITFEKELINTPYSVFCDLVENGNRLPKTTERVVSNKLTSFDKTGFGLTSDASKSLPSNNPTDNPPEIRPETLNFCFINDEGLSAWQSIIGSTNYEDFINGIETSYTCDDVLSLININEQSILNGDGALIIECDTPFGARTNLIKQLEISNITLISCQNTIVELQNQLNILQETYNEELTNSCIRPIDMFESLDLTMTLDVLSGSTYQTVYEATDFFPQIGFGSLYEYLVNNQNSGFYVCGGSDCSPMYLSLTGLPQTNTNSCQSVSDSLVQSLFEESGLSDTTTDLEIFNTSISNSAFTSSWLSHQTIISGDTILSAITDNKIRIGFKINYICDDICILVDNIQLNKVCTNVDKTNIFVSRSPGFELDRIRDNKKSWIKNTSLVNRDFEILNHKDLNPIRQTNYNTEDERLVINTKEIDLDINLASAISTDVWGFISDNPCLLTGFTYCNPCDACGYKTFQDGENFEFMDGQPYQFMDEFCSPIVTVPAIQNPIVYTAYTGSVSGTFDVDGTAFFKTNSVKPYNLFLNDVFDGDNVLIEPDVIVSGASNNLWDSNGSTTNGRLNNTGIWATSGAPILNPPYNEWIGFSKCIEIENDGVYSVGLAADNKTRFKINGELFYQANSSTVFSFRRWRVFEVTLSAGTNVIEMEGLNVSALASFGAEIYNAPIETLSAMTTPSQLSAVTIFSTADFRYETNGNVPVVFDLGESSGYSCPTGYFLNTCSIPYTCSKFVDLFDYKCCGDNLIKFDEIITTPLSSVTIVEDFEYIISSELIDAKNRQTISSYPTLKALYNRYINSGEYCGINSSGFNYQTMDQFANLVGDYWVDLIEQVIPSTSIWGSVKIYSNTIFDQQKFKYKSYSSLLCTNPFSDILVSNPINGTTGETENVEVIITNLKPSTDGRTSPTICNQLHIAQMNHGSEFIGTVNILGDDNEDCEPQEIAIDECTLQLSVDIDGVTAIPNVIGAKAPVTYLWSNGETGSTTTFPSGGTQSLTVTDANCCTATFRFFVDHLTACWYTLPDSNFFLSSGIFNPLFGITGYTYIMENLIVNGTEYVTGPEPTYALNDGNLELIPTNDGDLTYTNFVTFLNQTFTSLGLTEYSAQISLNNDAIRPPSLEDKYNGFYIIRPFVDTFTINIREDDNFDTSYTENSATEPIGLDYTKYRASVCEGITTQNGIVIE